MYWLNMFVVWPIMYEEGESICEKYITVINPNGSFKKHQSDSNNI